VFLFRMDVGGGFRCVGGGGLFVGWVVRANFSLCSPRDDGDLDGNRLPVVLLDGDDNDVSCLVCASLYPTS